MFLNFGHSLLAACTFMKSYAKLAFYHKDIWEETICSSTFNPLFSKWQTITQMLKQLRFTLWVPVLSGSILETVICGNKGNKVLDHSENKLNINGQRWTLHCNCDAWCIVCHFECLRIDHKYWFNILSFCLQKPVSNRLRLQLLQACRSCTVHMQIYHKGESIFWVVLYVGTHYVCVFVGGWFCTEVGLHMCIRRLARCEYK